VPQHSLAFLGFHQSSSVVLVVGVYALVDVGVSDEVQVAELLVRLTVLDLLAVVRLVLSWSVIEIGGPGVLLGVLGDTGHVCEVIVDSLRLLLLLIHLDLLQIIVEQSGRSVRLLLYGYESLRIQAIVPLVVLEVAELLLQVA